MRILLISTYDLGRQPFGVASPAAWLQREGFEVRLLDLAVEPFVEEPVVAADLIAFHLPMHTATRLAAGVAKKVRVLNPRAHLCFYGLYAPLNEPYLRRIGGDSILGGEFEAQLVTVAQRVAGIPAGDLTPVSLERQQFLLPARDSLPDLERYAQLHIAEGESRRVAYTEATRGCKHLCRHCPVVPVYNGAFRVVQRDIVLADIRQQVERGAGHVTFGDPDFFNGPTHSLSIVKALHCEFPELTYDVTIKIEHLLAQRRHLATLRDTGCLFVTSAVESADDRVLERLQKHHTREDIVEAVRIMRETGLQMNPTFVTFTPWTTLDGYRALLDMVLDLELVQNIAPIQYAIRLLIAPSSRLLELTEVQGLIHGFDEETLSHQWRHPDPRMDRLFETVLRTVQEGMARNESRTRNFRRIWEQVHEALDETLSEDARVARLDCPLPAAAVPYLTEPWYC